MRNYYDDLNINEDATSDEIKAAYRKLANKYHPDRNKEDKQAEEKFKRISEAYEKLEDTKTRAEHDRMLRNERETQRKEQQDAQRRNAEQKSPQQPYSADSKNHINSSKSGRNWRRIGWLFLALLFILAIFIPDSDSTKKLS